MVAKGLGAFIVELSGKEVEEVLLLLLRGQGSLDHLVVHVEKEEGEADEANKEEHDLERNFLLSLQLFGSQLSRDVEGIDWLVGFGFDDWGDDLSLNGGFIIRRVLGDFAFWLGSSSSCFLIINLGLSNGEISSVHGVFVKWLSIHVHGHGRHSDGLLVSVKVDV